MGFNVAKKLIASHLVEGEMISGTEIGLRIDQTLTQDATGTLVMLELEAMGIDRVQTELSVKYVDHNLLQEDYQTPEDHLFLHSGVNSSPSPRGTSFQAGRLRFSRKAGSSTGPETRVSNRRSAHE